MCWDGHGTVCVCGGGRGEGIRGDFGPLPLSSYNNIFFEKDEIDSANLHPQPTITFTIPRHTHTHTHMTFTHTSTHTHTHTHTQDIHTHT